MKESNRVRWALLVLGFAAGTAGLFFVTGSPFVAETGKEVSVDERARRIQEDRACLKRIEELARVYREEILPTRDQVVHNRRRLEEFARTLPPEMMFEVSNRDPASRLPVSDASGVLASDRMLEVLLEVLEDTEIWSRGGVDGKSEKQQGTMQSSGSTTSGDPREVGSGK